MNYGHNKNGGNVCGMAGDNIKSEKYKYHFITRSSTR
jgi:hypothetical protein